MMLFVAQYMEEADIIVDARDNEHALEVLREAGHEAPAQLREVPPGLFVAELYIATEGGDEDDDDDAPPNPANHSQTGVVFEPFEACAAWFAIMPPPEEETKRSLDDDAPASATAPTVPAGGTTQ